MTAGWYDLGQRLYAARTGQAVARLAHSPVPWIANPVAVRARLRRGTVTVTAAAPASPGQSAAGDDALSLLHDLGVTITAGTWQTLVTDDAATLPALTALADAASRDGDQAAAAAHIAWWADRADYQGSSAVVPLIAACRERWITGEPPAAETQARTWRTWLGVPDESCTGMLALLALLHDGPALPLLDRIERDDTASWNRASQEHAAGRDWRQPDSPARGAIGLQARCDVADLYEAALLGDPLYRKRAVHTGHVVTGTVQVIPGRRPALIVTCDRLDARLRAGNVITGWRRPGGHRAPAVHRHRQRCSRHRRQAAAHHHRRRRAQRPGRRSTGHPARRRAGRLHLHIGPPPPDHPVHHAVLVAHHRAAARHRPPRRSPRCPRRRRRGRPRRNLTAGTPKGPPGPCEPCPPPPGPPTPTPAAPPAPRQPAPRPRGGTGRARNRENQESCR